MSIDWLPSAITGVLGTAIGVLASRRKTSAETESIAVATIKSVLVEVRAELDRKEVELNHMRVKLDKLERNLTILSDMPPGHLG